LRLSLRWRVAAAFGLGSLLLTTVMAVATWQLASDYMLQQREQGALRQAEVNVRLVDGALQSGSQGLNELLTGLSTGPYSSVFLARPGSWLSSGRPVDPATLPSPLLALAHDRVPARQRLVVDGVPVLAVAIPATAPDTLYIELVPLVELAETRRFLAVILVAGTAASGLLGVGLGLWMSGRALQPLSELQAAAARVAGGDHAARLPEQDDPDLAPLASTFNATAAALERRVQQDVRFASNVSHELRSPLTTMANAVQLLERRRSEMSDTADQAVGLLSLEVHRFRHTVVDLLEISRDDQQVEQWELETVDLVDLVRNVVAHRPGTPPHLETDGRQHVVVADRRRLDRVVANLLDNADDHAGGPVRVAVLTRDGCARVEVDDAGPGVSEAMREQVFERFTRATSGRRADGTGSGLGLALVAQHVRRHGGRAWVEDRPGGGARFVVELPAAPNDPGYRAPAHAPCHAG
jgi:signal transduction histidine kinase